MIAGFGPIQPKPPSQHRTKERQRTDLVKDKKSYRREASLNKKALLKRSLTEHKKV
jgi:hypothetical protein